MTGWIGLYATGLMQGVPAYARVLELVIAKVSSNPDYPMILGFAMELYIIINLYSANQS